MWSCRGCWCWWNCGCEEDEEVAAFIVVRADEDASVVEDSVTTTDADPDPDPDVLRTTSGVNIAASNALGDAPYAAARRPDLDSEFPTTEEYSGGAYASAGALGGGAGLSGSGWMWTFSSIVIPVIIACCGCCSEVRLCVCSGGRSCDVVVC